MVGDSALWKSWWKDNTVGLPFYSRVLTYLEGRNNYISWVKKNCQTLKTVSNPIGLYPFLKCHQSFN